MGGRLSGSFRTTTMKVTRTTRSWLDAVQDYYNRMTHKAAWPKSLRGRERLSFSRFAYSRLAALGAEEVSRNLAGRGVRGHVTLQLRLRLKLQTAARAVVHLPRMSFLSIQNVVFLIIAYVHVYWDNIWGEREHEFVMCPRFGCSSCQHNRRLTPLGRQKRVALVRFACVPN